MKDLVCHRKDASFLWTRVMIMPSEGGGLLVCCIPRQVISLSWQLLWAGLMCHEAVWKSN